MDLAELLALQDGVVARRQLVELGLPAALIRRRLRRRELVVVHPGVYVEHTGPLTLRQRQWAAVLACWPAALSDRTVLEPAADGPVHVAVDVRRTLAAPAGVIVHRVSALHARVRWNASPPAVRFEHAVIDKAGAASDPAAAFAVLADAVQSRRISPGRLRDALNSRHRVRGRPLLRALVDDLELGACSVLERGYLGLERRHGLPSGPDEVERQRSVGGRYQDVRYPAYGVVVELDGRAFHDSASARDADASRDLDHAVDSEDVTLRLTYGQVFRDGCATAHKIGRLLQRRGWEGQPARCPDCP